LALLTCTDDIFGTHRFSTTKFEGDARFDDSWVRLDVADTVTRVWPTIKRALPGAFAVVPSSAALGGDGDWGLLEYGRSEADIRRRTT
jgi:hypothetical protein